MRRARLEGLLVCAGVLLFLFVPTRDITNDGLARYEALKQLAAGGGPQPLAYSYLGPLGAWPLYKLGLAQYYNALLWLGGAAFLAWALRGAVAEGVRRRFVLLLLFGTLAAQGVRDFYGEIFTTVLVGCGLAAALLRGRAWGWALVPLGVANAPGSFLGLALVTARQVWASKRFRFSLVLLAAVALYLLEGRWKMGAWGRTGYELNHGYRTVLPYSGLPGFSYPLFFGLLGLLFSFGKGLVFFAPGCFFPLSRRVGGAVKACQGQWLLFLAGLLLLYAKWWAWYGGGSFGPRFLTFAALPASLALAVYLEKPSTSWGVNLAALGALGLSLWVGICGTFFYPTHVGLFGDNHWALEHLEWYVPEFSDLWHPFLKRWHLGFWDKVWFGYAALLFFVLGADLLAALGRAAREGLRRMADAVRGAAWGF